MAIILKSNQELQGEDFKYLTDKGVVNELTYNLYNEVIANGFDLSSDEIFALNRLEQRIINANLKEKVKEIHPYVGNSFGALFFKLKSVRNNKLGNVYGMNTTENQDNGKGFYLTGRLDGAQGLDLDINLNDLKDGYELFFYSKHENSGGTQSFMGIGDGITVNNSFINYATADEKIGFGINTAAIASNNSVISLGIFKNYIISVSASNYNFQNRSFYVNNEIKFNNDSQGVFSTNSNTEKIYLGCCKSLTYNSILGYKGALRFSMITNKLNTLEREILNNAVLEFCTYLNK